MGQVGLAAQMNYCKDRLTSITLVEESDHDCCPNFMKQRDCCKSEPVLLKADMDEHQQASFHEQLPLPQFHLIQMLCFLPDYIPSGKVGPFTSDSQRPPDQTPELSLLCVFRI